MRSGATLDHVLPRARGGADIFENVVLCCYRCNQEKGSKLASEWEHIAAMGWMVEAHKRYERVIRCSPGGGCA